MKYTCTKLVDRRWAVVDTCENRNVHTYKPSQKKLAVAMTEKLNRETV